jgi:hypothetical protein
MRYRSNLRVCHLFVLRLGSYGLEISSRSIILLAIAFANAFRSAPPTLFYMNFVSCICKSICVSAWQELLTERTFTPGEDTYHISGNVGSVFVRVCMHVMRN